LEFELTKITTNIKKLLIKFKNHLSNLEAELADEALRNFLMKLREMKLYNLQEIEIRARKNEK